MPLVSLTAFVLVALGQGFSQEVPPPAPTAILFHLQRDEMKVRYSVQMQSDGLGFYWEGVPDFNVEQAVGARRITASRATLARLFKVTEAIKTGACETRSKNIAQTGRKTLVILTVGTPRCEFNYSDNDQINDAASAFQSIAETMQMGDKLKHDRRFDHLSLNADLESLTVHAKEKRAIELQNIAPILQSIVDDDDLMDVVHRRAQSLLQDASLQTTPSAR